MSEYEAEKVPETGTAGNMDGQTGTQLTVSGTFTSGLDASLDMSGIDDLGGNDEVKIAATSGGNHREQDWTPAPNSFPTDLDGGPWAANVEYVLQVSSRTNTTWTTWLGTTTPRAAGGTLYIQLNEQT